VALMSSLGALPQVHAALRNGLALEAAHGMDEGWDAPILIWSSQGGFESRTPSRAYHTIVLRLGGSRAQSFQDSERVWRPQPAGASLAICPAETPIGHAAQHAARFATIRLSVDLTRELCRALFPAGEPLRPFGARVAFCSDDHLCALAAELVLRALDERERPTRFEMNARTLLFVQDLLKRFSPLSPSRAARSGGLAPWQARRAEQLMLRDMAEGLQLSGVAQACELSIAHFSRSFHKTFGAPPYRWFQTRRIERAKSLLCETSHGLAEVALDCGFGDQSHFTKAFGRIVGVSPGAWRRMHRSAALQARPRASGTSFSYDAASTTPP
jgi:AraC-like DNA-binding protein